jgi:transcriptional regulator with XRE-family HTH domain
MKEAGGMAWSGRGLVLTYYGPDSFVEWLDHQLTAKVGRRKTDIAITQEAGIPKTALYRILRRGERPSRDVAAKLAAYLGVTEQRFRQHAGLDPVAVDGVFVGEEHTEEEIAALEQMMQAARDTWRAAHPRRSPGTR